MLQTDQAVLINLEIHTINTYAYVHTHTQTHARTHTYTPIIENEAVNSEGDYIGGVEERKGKVENDNTLLESYNIL